MTTAWRTDDAPITEADDLGQMGLEQGGKWRERKQTMTYMDQHGREWNAMTRLINKPMPAACGPYRPDGWSAPFVELLPPIQFIRPTRKIGRIRIDYAAWEQSLETAYGHAMTVARTTASELYRGRAGEAMNERDPEVMAAIGSLPLDPVFVQAMAHGDPWVLGLAPADQVPSWATPDRLRTIKSWKKAQDKAALKAAVTFGAPVPAARGVPAPFVPSPSPSAAWVQDAPSATAVKRTRPSRAKVDAVPTDADKTPDITTDEGDGDE